MALKVSLSFKEEEKDMYDFLQKQLSPSIYVKQLIQEKMKIEEKNKEPVKQKHDLSDMLNF